MDPQEEDGQHVSVQGVVGTDQMLCILDRQTYTSLMSWRESSDFANGKDHTVADLLMMVLVLPVSDYVMESRQDAFATRAAFSTIAGPYIAKRRASGKRCGAYAARTRRKRIVRTHIRLTM